MANMRGGTGTTSVLLALAGLWAQSHVADASTEYEWKHTIELAGYQRMYTQEMQKEFLLVAADCQPDYNREKLLESTAAYHKNLIDLRYGNATESVVAPANAFIEKDMKILWESWLPVRALLVGQVDTIFDGTGVSNLSALEEMTELCAPFIDLWDEVTQLLVDAARFDGVPTNGVVMDIAERQVMLVHKMGKETLKIGLNVKSAKNIELLMATRELFEYSHQGIIRGATWAGVPPLRNVCTLNQMREVTYYISYFMPPILEIFAARSEEESIRRASGMLKNITTLSDPLIKSMKIAADMFVFEPNTTTCLDGRTLTDDNWRTVILAAEDQNFFCAQAASLFMQVVLGFAVSASKVELTVLLDTASQSLQDLVEGDRLRNLVAPPVQTIVERLVSVQRTWRDLDLVLKGSVRSEVIAKTTVSEVARLADIVLYAMSDAVDLYVASAEEANTPVPVYALDLAGRQRTYIQKLAKETGLIGYGHDVEYNWRGLNASRDAFMSTHWKLLEGAPASGNHVAIVPTTDVCIVKKMKQVADIFGALEEAALAVAGGNLAEMEKLTRLNPEAIAHLDEIAAWYGEPGSATCEASILTADEWMGLIEVAGYMRSMSQEAAGDWIKAQESNGTSLDLAQTKVNIEFALRNLKFGSRLPSVPAPMTQQILDDVRSSVAPAVATFIDALNGQDAKSVLDSSQALLESTENLKKQYLNGASSSELAVQRYDLASRQVMLVKKMYKESLAIIFQVDINENSTALSRLDQTMAEFEASHIALNEGGLGLEPVILSRDDILDQWAVIDAAWKRLQPLLLTTNPLEAEAMEAAADVLSAELEIALPFYAIPDNPKPPELLWSALAYIGIATFVVGVCCAACCVLYSAHRRRKKEEGEKAADTVIPPMA